jgi:hypothetical protein
MCGASVLTSVGPCWGGALRPISTKAEPAENESSRSRRAPTSVRALRPTPVSCCDASPAHCNTTFTHVCEFTKSVKQRQAAVTTRGTTRSKMQHGSTSPRMLALIGSYDTSSVCSGIVPWAATMTMAPYSRECMRSHRRSLADVQSCVAKALTAVTWWSASSTATLSPGDLRLWSCPLNN